MGLIAGYLLILWGVYHAGVVKGSYLLPISLLCFGIGGVLFSVVLFFDGELGASLHLVLGAVACGATLAVIGALWLKKGRAKKE